LVGDCVLRVERISGVAREIVVGYGGAVYTLTEARQEIAPGVYVSRVPNRKNSISPRIAFEAPRESRIDRLERGPQVVEGGKAEEGSDELERILDEDDLSDNPSGEEPNFISSVSERDVDLLLLEEFLVNEKFQHWFCNQVFGEVLVRSWKGAWHSVVCTQGESDLIVKFDADGGERAAILIENKISAAAQPQQGARYRQRGELGVVAKEWNRFKTCLVAPDQYLTSPAQTEIYDAQVSYENLKSFFDGAAQHDRRFAYKSRFIQEAIEQNRRGYLRVVREEMTKFVKFYSSIATARYPELNVEEAKDRAPESHWIYFRPNGYPKGVYLCHQTATGFAKAFFSTDEHPALRNDVAI
jgi:hypothetical protein